MKKRIFVVITTLLLVLFTLGCGANAADAGYRRISQDQAVVLMKKERDYIILDVRTWQEFEEEHIKGAICVPVETIGDDAIPQLPNKDQLILVYCRSGKRSKQASAKLVKLGYTRIVEFGGIRTWTGETESGID